MYPFHMNAAKWVEPKLAHSRAVAEVGQTIVVIMMVQEISIILWYESFTIITVSLGKHKAPVTSAVTKRMDPLM